MTFLYTLLKQRKQGNCWNISFQQLEQRSLLEHTITAMGTDITYGAHYRNDGNKHYCWNIVATKEAEINVLAHSNVPE